MGLKTLNMLINEEKTPILLKAFTGMRIIFL